MKLFSGDYFIRVKWNNHLIKRTNDKSINQDKKACKKYIVISILQIT